MVAEDISFDRQLKATEELFISLFFPSNARASIMAHAVRPHQVFS